MDWKAVFALGPVSGRSRPARSEVDERSAKMMNPGRYEPVRSVR